MSDGSSSKYIYTAIMSRTHIRRSTDQWTAIIDQQAKSGLGAKDFCKKKKLGLSTFSKWERKLQLDGGFERKQLSGSMPAFQPVEIVPNDPVAPTPATRISLTLNEGITLTIERATGIMKPSQRWCQEQVFVYRHPVDMRKQILGLSNIVSMQLGRDPGDESMYVFVNKGRNQTTFHIPFVKNCSPISMASITWKATSCHALRRPTRAQGAAFSHGPWSTS